MHRSISSTCLAAVFVLAAATGVRGQDKYKTFDEAYGAGAKFVNAGNLAAAREPLEGSANGFNFDDSAVISI